MDCDRASELLHGYLDNELDQTHVEEIETHLGTCVSCREEHAQELKLRSLLQARATRYAAPAQLRSKILAGWGPRPRRRRLRGREPMGGAQFCGAAGRTASLAFP